MGWAGKASHPCLVQVVFSEEILASMVFHFGACSGSLYMHHAACLCNALRPYLFDSSVYEHFWAEDKVGRKGEN